MRLVVLVAAVLGGPLLVEGVLRAALFGDGWWSRRLVAYRAPELYADAESDELYWRLRYRMAAPPRDDLPNRFDPLLGWCGARVDPATYLPRRWPVPPGIRPVVLYGTSFSACLTPAMECFQGLLHGSDLGGSHALYNYGVGGYGLDQVTLLLRASVDHFAAREPVVVLGIVPAEDVDRVVLAFRDWPKPRFRLAGGALVEPEPVVRGSARYLELHPPETRSFLWRYLLYGTDLLPPEWRRPAAREREKRELTRALLESVRDELAARGVECFALLFHTRSCLESGGAPWEDRFVAETLDELGLPFVDTRAELSEDRSAAGRDWADYFFAGGAERGHLNDLGNEVCFRTLRRGLGDP